VTYHITGFDREEIINLCIRINSVEPAAESQNWPPCLGLFKSVVTTLNYMRHNRTQAEIGESFGVSQPRTVFGTLTYTAAAMEQD
jgi:hypothetical protein